MTINILRLIPAALLFEFVHMTTPGAEQIVIAHRGASGYLPEHTLEAYAMAYAMGAHYIEPDLVRTKDGAFICLHDIHLEATTNVEEVFPNRKRDDGRWYAADFTLEEVKRLNVHERLNGRFPRNHSSFSVPTFKEMIELVKGLNASTGRNVGIYPELKGPSFHEKEGLPMEKAFLDIVTRHGYVGSKAKIFVQCFDVEPLKKIRHEFNSKLPLIQLIGANGTNTISDEDLDAIGEYANGIGPNKNFIESDPTLVKRAQERGLAVHGWTLRADAVPNGYRSHGEEVRAFYKTYGVDGMFTDFPDRAVRLLVTDFGKRPHVLPLSTD